MSRKPLAKEVIVKLIVGAGQASPSPPVGPALGSKGVKSMDFCKEFNALTAHISPGTPTPCLITVRPDRSFYFSVRTPPTSTLLLAAAGVSPSKGNKLRGANAPGRTPEGSVNTSNPSLRTPAFRSSPQASPGGGSLPAGHSSAFSAGAGQEIGRGIVHEVSRAAQGAERGAGNGGGSAQVGEVSLKHIWEIAKIKQSESRLSGLGMEGLVRSVIAQARGIGVGVVP